MSFQCKHPHLCASPSATSSAAFPRLRSQVWLRMAAMMGKVQVPAQTPNPAPKLILPTCVVAVHA